MIHLFFFNDTATTEIYTYLHTLSLHDALPFCWPGDYDNYLRRREERLHAESQEVALFDKKMAQEEVWIRKGVQARRTRDMGRVKRLLEMREQYAQRRKQQGTAQFTLQDAERSGKLVAEAKNLSYAIGGKRSEEHTSELQS